MACFATIFIIPQNVDIVTRVAFHDEIRLNPQYASEREPNIMALAKGKVFPIDTFVQLQFKSLHRIIHFTNPAPLPPIVPDTLVAEILPHPKRLNNAYSPW